MEGKFPIEKKCIKEVEAIIMHFLSKHFQKKKIIAHCGLGT